MPITSFEADPPTIKKGETSTLKWTSEGCENLEILPPMIGQPVEPNGTHQVSPELSTVYMLEGQCSEEPNQWTVLVEVTN